MNKNIPKEEYDLWRKVNLWPSFTKELNKNPILDILQKCQAHIRFQVAKDVLGLPMKHPLVVLIHKKLHYQKKYKKILQREIKIFNSDNKKQRELNFIQLLQKLHELVSYGAYKHMRGVDELIIQAMEYQNSDGRFPGLYHHHAKMCGILFKLGLRGNRLLDRSLNWIEKRQREDGGWLHRSMVQNGKTIKNQRSCIWTSAEVLYSISLRSSFLKRNCFENGLVFLKKQLFNKNSTKFLDNLSPWDYFSVGAKGETLFTGGSLKILEIFVNHGFSKNDKVINKLVSGILSCQMDNGYFPFQKSKFPIPDPYVTVRFLRMLRVIRSNKYDKLADKM